MIMNSIPTPPESPELDYLPFDSSPFEGIMCGTCNKALGPDWFCSDCHRKCDNCNRFLCDDDGYCSRCWVFDPVQQRLIQKIEKRYSSPFLQAFYQQHYYRNILDFALAYRPTLPSLMPSPSNSTGSESNNNNNNNNEVNSHSTTLSK
ncbi:uncharacterized protein BX663DRAFT_558650 [Cokeromyces recurvatus]|uniref:uncharacterized protein n=1 Tax=Cokeromyces recurvatus TaxID=90255 RepID=UPI00221EFA65|nr:uncharacterized protein BX663DRAFT_558650 [Cokeromyces recurvatus]KAI7906087.1 hypothetical protein BX663DRAFT_558650 [Cokeromyces recurvatus]